MLFVEMMQHELPRAIRIGEHHAPFIPRAAETGHDGVGDDEPAIGTYGRMIAAHVAQGKFGRGFALGGGLGTGGLGGHAGIGLHTAVVAVKDGVVHLGDVPRIRLPRRMAPLRIHVEELFLGEAVTDQPLPRASALAARVFARLQRHLEKDALQIGAEDREKDGGLLLAESFREPLGVSLFQRGHGHGRLLLAGQDVDQIKVAVLARIPVRAVKRDEILIRLPPAGELAPGQDALLQRVQVHAAGEPFAVALTVKDHAPAAGNPLLARGAVGVLGIEIGREHLFLARLPIPHDNFAPVPIGCGRGIEQHVATVRTLGAGVEIRMDRVPPLFRSNDADLHPAAPRRERIVRRTSGGNCACNREQDGAEQGCEGLVHRLFRGHFGSRFLLYYTNGSKFKPASHSWQVVSQLDGRLQIVLRLKEA
ncbi:MAG: hypothetical protein EB034_19510, partial [Verrucomicrobia bacterium]|nr:hypothetical protein [Verrucomicrobiota bacterium]